MKPTPTRPSSWLLIISVTLLISIGISIKPWSAQVKTPPTQRQLSSTSPDTLSSKLPDAASNSASKSLSAPVPSPIIIADNIPATLPREVADFRRWARDYLAAPADQRGSMLADGKELAKRHTATIAKIIPLDPEQAIALAVPMVIRQDLPDAIVTLLENRVNIRASLDVIGHVPLPGQENSPDFKPYTRMVSTEAGDNWNAYVYGKRGQQHSLASTSINGISVGYDMAIADSPLRRLENGERPIENGREVVESCPVSKIETAVERTESGTLPPVTEDTPAFETPERIVFVCSSGHIEQTAEDYSAAEEQDHWKSRETILNAGAGSGPALSPTSTTIPSSATTGHRTMLYIRATFPDNPVDPQSEAECHESLRQMSEYISKTSYGSCYFTYTVAPLIVLPYPESWYIAHQTESSTAYSTLRNHALNIARAMGYDFRAYDHDVVRWNGSVGSFGGNAPIGGRWINVKTNSVGTLCHELGHNLGIWHANYWQSNPPSSIGTGTNGEYGNTFDLMGSSGSLGQFTSSAKNVLNWIPNDNHWIVNYPGVYRIHQTDHPIADPKQRVALRIKKDTERDYWAEFRQLHTTNPGFMNGLMITWDRWGQGNIGGSGGAPPNGSNGGAQLLDMTPGSFGNGITDTRNDSALWIGRTFTDPEVNIHITPIAKNATTPPSMDVYVHTGDTPGNLAPTLSINASSTSVATNANVTLTATASDPNGDPIAYAWIFNDGTYSTNNSAVQTKSWSAAGRYQVLCTASDMKGKRTTRAILITVGSPTTFSVSGTITGPDMQPIEGVYVASHAPSNSTSHPSSSTFRGTWTDSDGNYTLTNLASGNFTISADLYPNVFTPSNFTNPLTVNANQTNKNFGSTLLPTITLNVIDDTAHEGPTPGTGTIRIERTGSTASALSVQIFNTNTGTSTRNTDYTLSPAPTASTEGGGNGTSQYTIPAGASFLDITVTPINDSTAEGTEFASLDFANTSSGYILSGSAVARVNIIDDDSPNLPVVTLSHIDNVAFEEGTDTATLQLSRNGSTAANLTVNLTMSGTATNNSDYTIPSSVVIPAGSSTANVILTPIDDTAQETTETATVTIATNAAYSRDSISNSQSITIHDNDLPIVSIAATDSVLTEAPGDIGVFTISRTGGNPYQALTVDYTITGRAIHGSDYRRLEGRAVIPAGASSTTVEIYPYDDDIDEATQDIILTLRSTTSYMIGGTGTATMSIIDNDNSQFYIKLTQSGIAEPASGSTTAVTYQIIRPASGSAVTVNYAVSGTATNGLDYTTLTGTIAFTTSETSKTINVAALADALLEDPETVTLTLLPGTGYSLMTSQPTSATGYILDRTLPTIDISAANTVTNLTTDGSETSTSLRFVISRKTATASDLAVNYTMSGTATVGVDYTGTTGTATIPANATSVFVTLVPVNDTIPEGVETIIMNITPAPGTYGIRTGSATMYLADNDNYPSGALGFAATTSTTNEAAGIHNVAVNITGSPAGTITAHYRVNVTSTSTGTATGYGYDYTLLDGILTFPPGTTTLNIPIIIHPDTIAEPSETILLELFRISGGNTGTSTHTVTINNISMPEAYTDAPSNLLANSVTLNGRVIPNNLATNVWFEYGPTSAYGSTTTPQAIGSGATSVNVNASLSGFAPGGYHYRCVAQNSMGTSYGINQIVPSSDANLANLVTSSGSLSPAFSPSNLVYSVVVSSSTSTITVTPTVSQPNATIKINGITVASTAASNPITLATGVTQIPVLVTAQDGVTTKTYTLNVDRQTSQVPQTITFGPLAPKSTGDAPFALTTTASSGLPVSYTSSNPTVASVSGATVTILSAGTTIITASQDGDDLYAPATPVEQTLTVFAIPTYTISYNGNGHTGGTPPANQSKIQDINLTLAPQGSLTRTGHTFAGWNTVANGSGTAYPASGTYSANAAATLFAQWTPNSYTLTFEPNGGEAPSQPSKTVTYNAAYGTLATITRIGYTFDGWFTAPSGGTLITSATVVATPNHHSLFAQWSPNTYTVTFLPNGGNTPAPSSKEVTFDAPYGSLATVTRPGYSFNGWFIAAVDGSRVTEENYATTPGNHNLFAQWSPLVISVVSDQNSVNVPEGSTNTFQVKLSDLPLANVIVTVARTSGDESITVTTGTTLTFTPANWNTYQTVILASAVDADTDNDTATITCTPNDPNYTAKNVSAIQIDKDTTLTVASDTHGSTIPNGPIIVEKSASTPIAATPDEGYDFLNWTITSGSATILDANDPTTTVTLAESATVQANFTIKTYLVSYDGNGNTGGTIPTTQTKNHGQNLTLANNTGNLSKNGFSFSGWNTSPEGTGTDYPVLSPYTNNAVITLYAKWTPGNDGTWLPTTTGPFDWGTSTNWSGGNIASGSDRTAFFTPNITANQTANLESPRTIGNITFTDSTTNSHNLTISGAQTLTLARSSGTPIIDVTQSTRTLTIASLISGTSGLQKNGAGTLTLTSTASDYSGGTTLNGGTVIVSGNGSLGAATTPITVNASSSLTSVAAASMEYPRAITLGADTILTLQNNTGSTTATFSESITGSGGITVAGGAGTNTVSLSSTSNTFTSDLSLPATNNTNLFVNFASIGDGGMISLGKGSWRRVVQYTGATDLNFNTRRIDLNSSFGGVYDGSGNPIQLFENNGSGKVTFNTNLTIADNRTGTFFIGGTNIGDNTLIGLIPNSTGGTLSIAKVGTGKWILTNDNTFTGYAVASGGTLSVGKITNAGLAQPLGTGSIIQIGDRGNSGNLEFTGSNNTSTTKQIQIGGTVLNNTGAGSILNNGTGSLNFSHDTFNIAQTGTTATRTLTLGGTNTGANTISGGIQNNDTTGVVAITKSGIGTWVLKGANTFTGATTITNGGTLMLDYTTSDSTKLSDTNALILNTGAGNITLRGGFHNEQVASLTIGNSTAANTGGHTAITRDGGSAKIAFGPITRTLHGYTTVSLGGDDIATTTSNNVNGMLSGGITIGSNWAKNDGSGNIVSLGSGDYTTLAATGGTGSINYQLIGSLTRTAAASINSLRIVGNADNQSLNMGTLNLTPSPLSGSTAGTYIGNSPAGGILYAGGGNNYYTITGTGNLQAQSSNQELVIHTFQGTLNLDMKLTMGSQGLTKAGAGTLILSRDGSTYTGATHVNQGVLLVNATISSSTGGVTVANNAALGGTGSIGGNVTVRPGGGLRFDLTTPAASHNPLDLAATRTITFSGSSVLTITSSGGTPAPGSYTLMSAPGGIVGSAPTTLNLPGGWAATASIVGNDLVLNVTTVPSNAVASFSFTGIPPQVPVGQPVTGITITARDAFNNVSTSFTGTVTFSGTAGISGTSANFVSGVLTGVSITPNTPGFGRTLIATDAQNNTGTATFDVLTPYQTWASQNNLTAGNADPNANPDGDTLNNLQEYAFGTNPNAGGQTISYTAGGAVSSGGPPIAINMLGGGGVDYRAIYTRRKDRIAAGITYTVKFSADLTHWTTSNATPTILTGNDALNPGPVEAVSVPYPLFVPVTGGGFKKPTFFVVEVSIP